MGSNTSGLQLKAETGERELKSLIAEILKTEFRERAKAFKMQNLLFDGVEDLPKHRLCYSLPFSHYRRL